MCKAIYIRIICNSDTQLIVRMMKLPGIISGTSLYQWTTKQLINWMSSKYIYD